jgi:hypothetical protein
MAKDEHQYLVIVLRGWTKEGLAVKIRERLDPFPQESIVILEAGVDFQFPWPFRRNWALIVVKRPEAPAI